MKPILLKHKTNANQTEYIVLNQITKLTDIQVGSDGTLNTRIDFIGGAHIDVETKVEEFLKWFDIIEVSK